MGQSKKQAEEEAEEQGIVLAELPTEIQTAVTDLLALPVSAAQVAASTWGKTMAAESSDKAFEGITPVSSRDYTDRPFVPIAIHLRDSQFKGDGFRFYGSIDAVTPDGEPVVINTSSADGLIKLVAFHTKGWLPLDYAVKFERSERQTAAGFYPLKLVRA